MEDMSVEDGAALDLMLQSASNNNAWQTCIRAMVAAWMSSGVAITDLFGEAFISESVHELGHADEGELGQNFPAQAQTGTQRIAALTHRMQAVRAAAVQRTERRSSHIAPL